MPFAETRERIAELTSNLDRKQKMMAIAGGVAFLLLTVILGASTLGSQSRYVVAFSGLSPEDAAAIVDRLQEENIPYEITSGESVIKVPDNEVHDVRLKMASLGLPSGGTVGFEIFDSTNLGMTDFTQQLNYRRALEGELERTISSLDAVEQARVHIVIPQQTIYSDLEKPPTASVLVKLQPGRRLGDDQVTGITHLVSTSVEGLTPDNITIVDTKGNILNDGLATDTQRINDDRFKAQQAYEDAIEAKIHDMLTAVLGPNRAVVSVAAQLDWSQTETSMESYQPSADGTQVVRSSRELRESYNGTPTAAEGVPGVDSNLPVVPSYSGQASADQNTTTTTGNGRYERSDLTYNYEISKIISRTIDAPGKLTGLSISVLLDEVTDDAQLERIRQAVVAAAGIDATRGDTITVESIAFDRTYIEEQEAEMGKVAREAQYMTLARWGAIALAGIVLLLVMRNIVLRVVSPVAEAPGPSVKTLRPAMEELGAGVSSSNASAFQLPNGEKLQLSADQQAISDSVQKHHQLVSLAQKQPELIAQIIQFWLNESDSRRRRS